MDKKQIIKVVSRSGMISGMYNYCDVWCDRCLFTSKCANLASDFKAKHRLSLADAFAAALSKSKKAELLTGDPEFKVLGKEISIQLLT